MVYCRLDTTPRSRGRLSNGECYLCFRHSIAHIVAHDFVREAIKQLGSDAFRSICVLLLHTCFSPVP
jgi:hypothetical protein